MSIWNTSHQIGGGLIVILCGFLVAQWGWRSCFLVPAGIALLGAWYLSRRLPDTPPSVGLPEVEGTHGASGEQTSAQFNAFILKQVFQNKYIWLVSFGNFFVYTMRYAVFNWGPTLLTDTKHLRIVHAGLMMAGFEWAGAIGALVAGRMVNTVLLCSTGFFIYGPQCLIGIAAANLATKRAAATAIGLTSIFGYASTILSGVGLGWLQKHYGWDAVFEGLLLVAAVGVLVFAACWPAKADGYGE